MRLSRTTAVLLLGLATAPAPAAPAPAPAQAAAPAFHPCAAPDAHAFDFWHGDWTVNNRFLTPNGWVDAGAAEVRVDPAVGGCVTIEHWRGNLGPNAIVGFSARAWDERTGRWVLLLNWPQPDRSTFSTLEGTFRHGRGEFFTEGVDAKGNPRHTRFSFSDIAADRFRWDQAFSTDRESWRTTWIMEYSRRDPASAIPSFPGAATSTDRCGGPEYRQLDGLIGDWRVETEIPRRSGEPKRQTGRMRTVPILEGCALLEFFEAQAPDEEEPFMAFRVRAWDGERWVQYWYDSVERAFQRFEGSVEQTPEGARLLLESRPDPEAPRIDRIEWTGIGTDTPVWSFTMSVDGGASWRAHAVARLSLDEG